MNILTILSKIWLYGGYFYLSFFTAILFFLIKKQAKIFLYLLLIVNSIFSLRTVFINIKTLGTDLNNFFLTPKEKINTISSNQSEFLNTIIGLLPKDKNICYPWPSDIAGRYAQQYLYPRKVTLSVDNLDSCDYLVLDYSIPEREYNFDLENNRNYSLIFINRLGKVFKKINDS